MRKIKRCPFCTYSLPQLKRITKIKKVGEYKYYVHCGLCKARGPIKDSEDKAIEVWNNANKF